MLILNKGQGGDVATDSFWIYLYKVHVMPLCTFAGCQAVAEVDVPDVGDVIITICLCTYSIYSMVYHQPNQPY